MSVGKQFWIAFYLFWFATLFIPVWPLYKGDILVWFAPVYAVYASLFAAPEYSLLAIVVIPIHIAVCLFMATMFNAAWKKDP